MLEATGLWEGEMKRGWIFYIQTLDFPVVEMSPSVPQFGVKKTLSQRKEWLPKCMTKRVILGRLKRPVCHCMTVKIFIKYLLKVVFVYNNDDQNGV